MYGCSGGHGHKLAQSLIALKTCLCGVSVKYLVSITGDYYICEADYRVPRWACGPSSSLSVGSPDIAE